MRHFWGVGGFILRGGEGGFGGMGLCSNEGSSEGLGKKKKKGEGGFDVV